MEDITIIKDISSIVVKKDNKTLHEIITLQEFYETDDRVYLKCAEYVPHFVKGFTCDFDVFYSLRSENSKDLGEVCESFEDLVLVYVNKEWRLGNYAQFEYVFFK